MVTNWREATKTMGPGALFLWSKRSWTCSASQAETAWMILTEPPVPTGMSWGGGAELVMSAQVGFNANTMNLWTLFLYVATFFFFFLAVTYFLSCNTKSRHVSNKWFWSCTINNTEAYNSKKPPPPPLHSKKKTRKPR